jgi:hypothetical protein
VRPIRGAPHPSDDERTVEALPEEPTLSVQVDVRAAFEQQDLTLPGAVAVLVPREEPTLHRQEHTLPLVPRSDVQQALAALPAAPLPVPRAEPVHHAMQMEVAEDPPYDVPGLDAQRRRMQRIVISVLSFCALLGIAALVRQLWPTSRSEELPSKAMAIAAPPPESPIASASAIPAVAPPPEPPAAPVAAVPVAPAPVAAVPVAVAVPAAVAAVGPTRPPEARGAAVRPKPISPAVPPPAKPPARSSIVRDSPF